MCPVHVEFAFVAESQTLVCHRTLLLLGFLPSPSLVLFVSSFVPLLCLVNVALLFPSISLWPFPLVVP